MEVRAITWNLFHGRDHPPDPALLTLRSRLTRRSERGATHIQVNRELRGEFARVLCGASWDVALLQEAPPRWRDHLARACDAEAHASPTSRNSFAALRALAARLNPDLIASNEGGSNTTLVRRRAWRIVERRELVLCPGPRPERRTMAFTVLAPATEAGGRGLAVANLHASTGASNRARAEREIEAAAEAAVEWAAGAPLVLGGDLNVRPRESAVFDRLAERWGLAPPTADGAIDHLLSRGLELLEPPRAWPPELRELEREGLRLRLSDHAPVQARWKLPAA